MDYRDYIDRDQEEIMNILKEKLSENEWREADEITKFLMIKDSTYKDGNYVSLDIKKLSFSLVEEIDKLWRKNSNCYFGFSVQKEIFQRKDYSDFLKKVKWHQEDSWLSYEDLFVWDKACKGHLPYFGLHFWKPIWYTTDIILSRNHVHQPHYHPPHQHGSNDAATAASIAAGAIAVAPYLIAAAAVGGAGYLIYREVTKDERKRKEQLEREEQEREEQERRLEEDKRVKKNIKSLLKRFVLL